MEIKDLVQIQKDFDLTHYVKKSFYTEINESNLYELEHLIVCLIGELGEFSNILKKVIRGDLNYSEAKPLLNEEYIDVFIYLIKISSQFNIDIEAEYLKKMEKNSLRFNRLK